MIRRRTCQLAAKSLGVYGGRNFGQRNALRAMFSQVGGATVEDDQDLNKQREEKIRQLLMANKDVVDVGVKKKGFMGMLVVCPTPVGNIRDVSLRVLEVLEAADIIACEDTRIAGKLFNLIKEKKIKEQFIELQVGNDPPAVFDDATIFGEDTRKHNNMGNIRREKKRLKEIYQREEFAKAIESSKSILRDIDSFKFHYDKSERDESKMFDSRYKRPKDKAIYGLDNPYIEYLKEKVQESRLKKDRGMFMSVHKFNEEGRIEKLIQALQAGFIVALISDAGTPTISDPGHLLVDACIKNSITVEALPGPNIVSIALSASGLPSDRFTFSGYLSKTASIREEELVNIRESGRTAVLFENKHRLLNLLRSIENLFGPRQVIYIGIELTKMHERHIRGEVSEIFEQMNTVEDYKSESVKGEVTLIIAPRSPDWNKDLKAENPAEIAKKKEVKRYEIQPDALVKLLKDRLEIGSRDLSELTADILNIPVKQARDIVQKQQPIRHPLYKTSKEDEI